METFSVIKFWSNRCTDSGNRWVNVVGCQCLGTWCFMERMCVWRYIPVNWHLTPCWWLTLLLTCWTSGPPRFKFSALRSTCDFKNRYIAKKLWSLKYTNKTFSFSWNSVKIEVKEWFKDLHSVYYKSIYHLQSSQSIFVGNLFLLHSFNKYLRVWYSSQQTFF